MRKLLVSCLVLGLALVARAQDGEESAIFQEHLARLLDRFNDDAPRDRLAKAIEICEKHLRDSPDDAQAQLELARFKLAKGEDEPAAIAAIRAEDLSARNPERLKEARALHLVAFSMAGTRKTNAEADADKYKSEFVALYKKLTEAAGSQDAADLLVTTERERVAQANVLNELGKPAPPLAAKEPNERKDVDGKPVRLDAFLGKVVIVDFWVAAYEPYRKEIANTVAVYEKYKDKLEVVGISLDTDRAQLDAFVKANAVPWRQIFSGRGPLDDTAAAWKVPGVRRYVIDQDGKVRFVNVRGEGLAAAVKQLVERATRGRGAEPRASEKK